MGKRKDTSRRWVRRVGWLLIAAGVAVLAWAGWQMWGTTWQSQREHEAIVEALEENWREPVTREPIGKVADWPAEQVSAIVRIPRFGDDYAVPVLEGTTDEVLAAGFGHFEDSADAGTKGNYAISGHRVTHGEPLRDMPELQVGDQIVVETRTAVHTYVLDTGGDDLVVPFTAMWVVQPLPDNPDPGGVEPPSQEPGQRLISLTTCAELFHTDDRMIAFGHLVETERKDRPARAAP